MRLFSKMKDYNSELEEILENKYFSSNIKNLLLSMIYKLEISYTDFEKVKRVVRNKNEFLEEIMETIRDYCENIKTVEPDSNQAKMLIKHNVKALTNEKERSILAYPTELSFLYAISDIIPKYYYIKNEFVYKKLFQNMLVEGYILNNLEILNNFNGWSWDVSPKEDFNFVNNLIYQNLLLITGEDFLKEWRDSSSIKKDFLMNLKKYIKSVSGTDDYFYELCKVLYLNSEEKYKNVIDEFLKKKSRELTKMQNKEKYLNDAKNTKLKLTKNVENIDLMLNDDKLLIKEFKKRNKKLEEGKKISTPLILKNILERERKKYLEHLSDISFLLKPENYVRRIKELQEYHNLLKNENNLNQEIINLEKCFLNFLDKKINKMTDRNQIIDIIYYIRYFKNIYINKEKTIDDLEELSSKLDLVLKKVITIACKNGIIKIISMDISLNYEIIKYALDTRIIDLEDIRLFFEAEDNTLLINVYDKENFEKQGKKEIENAKKQLEVRSNKMIKLFN